MAIRAPRGTLSTSKDYSTGYRHHYVDIDVEDRRPNEPTQIRASAREHSKNRWTVQLTRGPHEERDESGSYYRSIETDPGFEGAAGLVNAELHRRAKSEYLRLIGERG